MTEIETVVIGGGPAGAATAAGLAAVGREVLLFEKSSAPHHKVCGEFLSAEAQEYLAALDIIPIDLGAVPIEQLALSSNKSIATAGLPFQGLSLSRYRLDEALLARAEANGAIVRRGMAVRAAVRNDATWTVHTADSRLAVRCRNLVIATGKVPLRGFEDNRDRSFVGLKIHLRAEKEILQSVERKTLLHFFEQGYAGLQPIDGDTANLCWFVPSDLVKRMGRSWEVWRAYLTRSAPVLANLISSEAIWDMPLTIVCPRGAYLRHDPDTQTFNVGDRIAHIPPFTGGGLGIAMTTAALAAKHIEKDASPGEFAKAAERLLLKSLKNASVLSKIGRSGMGRMLVTKGAACMPRLLNVAVRQTRIPALTAPPA
jgi:flavin-dependent dehydrogenase